MTLLYYDPKFRDHKTGSHPECAARIVPVMRHLNFVALDVQCKRHRWDPCSVEDIQRVHDLSYIERLDKFCEQGGGYLDPDTVASRESYDVALLAAGAVCDATRRVVAGEDTTAFCLVRPPGHHAEPQGAMGFCLFNNVAIAARLATEQLGIERVLIVDWDVHHGNGTQDTFWEDPRVGFFSIHRWPFYPGTGAADETGVGPGAGTTCNVPVEFGTSRQDYLRTFTERIQSFAGHIAPQLVFVSAGFDAHRDDPIGSLGLEAEDFEPLTQIVLDVADRHAGGRVVSVLEGGYNPEALTACVELHLEALLCHRERDTSA